MILDENNTDKITWSDVLAKEKEAPYFKAILKFLEEESAAGKRIYPPKHDIFNAIKTTPFEKVKVVIIGQDPYHGYGQAHGLSFSVQDGVRMPPSLINIFKEIESDLGKPFPKSGNLTRWAEQGVLLLNAVLTVEEGKPQSHANIGWERFTDKIIEVLNKHKTGLVFLLWGAYAQRKAACVDKTKHSILTSVHPSPLSAHRGFLGCKHFSKTNEILKQQGQSEIIW